MTYSVYPSQQQKLISKKPTKRKQWSTILTAISEIKRRKKNSKRSMKHTKSSEIQRRKKITINSVLPNEVHSEEWEAIHSEDNTVVRAVRTMGDLKIYSPSSVVWVVGREDEDSNSI